MYKDLITIEITEQVMDDVIKKIGHHDPVIFLWHEVNQVKLLQVTKWRRFISFQIRNF